MLGRPRIHPWRAACVAAALACAAGHARPVLAQGQDSETATMGSHTNAHPPPVLSTIDITAVPSGQAVPGVPIPASLRRDGRQAGLAPAGEVPLRSPERLYCSDIQDRTARERCEARKAPAAPPKGAG
jgi:hypothetical protein